MCVRLNPAEAPLTPLILGKTMSEIIAVAELQADKEDLRCHLGQATAISIRQQTEPAPPALRVIEGGRTKRISAIEFAAEQLRELERELASAREDLRRLLASLGPVSPTINWQW